MNFVISIKIAQMKWFLFFTLMMAGTNSFGQGVVASGIEPAWLLDWDGGKNYTLYLGENVYSYTLVSKSAPEGSFAEISESWVFKGEKNQTAVLIIEYFDPESAESCPCFHDFGEGLNAGKAYLVTENQQFLIGCAEYPQTNISTSK
jgi:hypothetical protein